MNQQFLEQGIKAIAVFFNGEYKPESIRMISGALLPESDAALKEAYRRCITEFNTLPPVARVRDIILQEGRKIREQEAIEREREAQRQKAYAPKGLPDGHNDYTRACCEFLQRAFSGRYTREELRPMAEKGEKQFPGRGFDAWLKGSLSKGKVIELDRS